MTLSEGAVLPTQAYVDHLAYSPITSARAETDLEFWSTYSFGANEVLEVGIIHYNGQTATLSYFQTFDPVKGLPKVVGRAPHQQVKISAAWITDDDPECCAIRTYVDTIGFRVQRFSGGYVSRTYVVTSSTQSWLGVYAALPPTVGSEPPPDPVVLSVVQGGPAAGILQPGDQLISVAGGSVPSTSSLGPPVIDEVARSLPGTRIALTIERNGAQQVVNITLSSTASDAFTSSSAPSAGNMIVTSI